MVHRGLSFKANGEGAVLTMPEGATTLLLRRNVSRVKAYAAAHLENWYRYVNGPQHGMEVGNGKLRLVIGCGKTHSWGMAAVANVTGRKTHDLKFYTMHEDSLSATSSVSMPPYRWEYSGIVAQTQVGPDPTEIEALNGSDNSEEPGGRCMNQCLFVETINLTLQDDEFQRIQRDVEAALIKDFRQNQPGATTQNSHTNASTQTGGSNDPVSQMEPQVETERDSCDADSGTVAEIVHARNQRNITLISPSAQVNIAICSFGN